MVPSGVELDGQSVGITGDRRTCSHRAAVDPRHRLREHDQSAARQGHPADAGIECPPDAGRHAHATPSLVECRSGPSDRARRCCRLARCEAPLTWRPAALRRPAGARPDRAVVSPHPRRLRRGHRRICACLARDASRHRRWREAGQRQRAAQEAENGARHDPGRRVGCLALHFRPWSSDSANTTKHVASPCREHPHRRVQPRAAARASAITSRVRRQHADGITRSRPDSRGSVRDVLARRAAAPVLASRGW